ncbi:choice-of-anchor P family protein [Actinopolymorpha pittospori]|uniref:Uncharacterized protein n=1 Tax=Actinopolymorpha pittospori TaxID=648752 RepID=A0A927MNZ8_9ACTN|nr:choice-of-anchor P family protein [Actinopolymorpha pittospori]MBE1604029.1 hypothetical protein [Actinopolymorpha pittospori]
MHLATLARRGTGVLVSVGIAAAPLVPVAPAQAATAKPGYVAQAYGTYVFNGAQTVVSGPTAYSDIACGAAPGTTDFNNSSLVVLPLTLGRVSAQLTRVQALESGNTRTAVATSQTNGINLLGGIITSGLIQTSTRTTFNGSTYSAVQSTSIADLRILGVSVGLNPAPNTRINLALPVLGTVGYVEVNRQINRVVDGGREAITTALHLVLLPNNPWVPGADFNVWIANAKAQLTKPAVGFLKGQGFATRITLADGAVSSGPTALAKVPCTGGNTSNTIASIHLPGNVVVTGAATSTGVGSTTASNASSTVTDTIASVNILNGLIRADTVKAVATATRAGSGPIQLSEAGSEFVNLVIAGEALSSLKVKPNTKVELLNGAVTVNLFKIKRDARTIEVTMIELVITGAGTGLPIGSKVEIGRAYAGITPAAG